MLEATAATVIVGLSLVASLRAVQSSVIGQRGGAEVEKAAFLATALMSEIKELSYQNPTQPVLFGPESGETGRNTFNDVDDYNGWSESPPQNPDGTILPDLTGWTRKVTVQWVSPTNVAQTSSTETGAKLITVTVLHSNVVRATRLGVRTNVP
jgi:type II secretory pathway pseudopilin PulG